MKRALISYERTTSVGFCLLRNALKWDFIAFIMQIISIRKRNVDMEVVNDVTRLRQSIITRVVIRFVWHDLIHWITAMACDKFNYVMKHSMIRICCHSVFICNKCEEEIYYTKHATQFYVSQTASRCEAAYRQKRDHVRCNLFLVMGKKSA